MMLKQVEVGRGGGSEASLASGLNSDSVCGVLLGGSSSGREDGISVICGKATTKSLGCEQKWLGLKPEARLELG